MSIHCDDPINKTPCLIFRSLLLPTDGLLRQRYTQSTVRRQKRVVYIILTAANRLTRTIMCFPMTSVAALHSDSSHIIWNKLRLRRQRALRPFWLLLPGQNVEVFQTNNSYVDLHMPFPLAAEFSPLSSQSNRSKLNAKMKNYRTLSSRTCTYSAVTPGG